MLLFGLVFVLFCTCKEIENVFLFYLHRVMAKNGQFFETVKFRDLTESCFFFSKEEITSLIYKFIKQSLDQNDYD